MKRIYEDQDYREELQENSRQMIVSRYEQNKVWQAIQAEYNLLIKAGKMYKSVLKRVIDFAGHNCHCIFVANIYIDYDILVFCQSRETIFVQKRPGKRKQYSK